MAIDFGSSNPSRYYTVSDHADFTLPDSDWTWIALVEFNGSTSVGNYIVSTGDWGAANSLNLYTYGITAGTAVKVATLPEIWLTTEPLVAGKPYWVYAVRRSGVLRAGQIAVGGSSASESASTSITGSQNSSTGPYLGNRAAGLVRPWNGRWSQIAFVSGAGITAAQVVELANGAPLLSMPFAPNIKALWHGRNANDAAIADLISGHVATKQGTSYGTNEEDAQTPYLWAPSYLRAAASGGSNNLSASNASQANTTSAAAISQAHALGGAASAQANSASTGTITQAGSFAADNVIQSNASSTGSITQIHVLVADSATQGNTASTGAITQGAQFAADPATQANTAGTGSITQAHSLTAAGSTQPQAASAASITQAHVLAGAGATQANTAASGAISTGVVHNLAASQSTQANTGSAGAISQAHVLVLAPSIQDNIAAASAIVQAHVLAALSVTQSNSASSGAITAGDNVLVSVVERTAVFQRSKSVTVRFN